MSLTSRCIRSLCCDLRLIRSSSRIKLITVICLIVLTALYVMVMYDMGTNRLRDGKFLELTSCPACYGRKMCNHFHSGAIKFTGYSRLPSLHFLNVKNVHRATLKGEKIILKKLAHDKELDSADQQICQITRQPEGCHAGDSLFRHEFDAGEILHPATLKGLSDLVACPSPRLIERIDERFNEKEEYLLHSEKLMIFTTLLINPEPIILQIFPSKEGWPFPKFHGACGRWVAVEEIPNPLITYINTNFKKRVQLARQVFQIANHFTYNDDEFALYWTDVDYDNYAVRDDGTVVIVDAENIQVVDKQRVRTEKKPGWDIPLYSKYDECKKTGTTHHSCLSYEPDELCRHVEADLNYYAVCRGILAPDASQPGRPNLLHDVPGWVDDKWDLTEMLTECSKPKHKNGRFLLKDKMLTVFDEIIRGSPL